MTHRAIWTRNDVCTSATKMECMDPRKRRGMIESLYISAKNSEIQFSCSNAEIDFLVFLKRYGFKTHAEKLSSRLNADKIKNAVAISPKPSDAMSSIYRTQRMVVLTELGI